MSRVRIRKGRLALTMGISQKLTFVLILQHTTIDGVLARGEKLDSLVEKSSELSLASKVTSRP